MHRKFFSIIISFITCLSLVLNCDNADALTSKNRVRKHNTIQNSRNSSRKIVQQPKKDPDVKLVTCNEFLAGLLSARGIDWSSSSEYIKNDPAGFILRTGIVTDKVENLNANPKRRDVLRWCIESLGLKFEAGILNDMPSEFKDYKKLTDFERGCLYVATEMNPAIFAKADYFRGDDFVTEQEMKAILTRVNNASLNLKLDVVRHPLEGFEIVIHREGVFTGIPSWQLYAENFKSALQMSYARKFFSEQGFKMNIIKTPGGGQILLYPRTDDYNQIRRLSELMNMRAVKYRISASVANSNTSILPKYWVMLLIDPEIWNVQPIVSREGANILTPLSQIARENNSKAAINAGFFGSNKGKIFPVGALRINGYNLSTSYHTRGCVGWNDINDAMFACTNQENINTHWSGMRNIIQAGPLIMNRGYFSSVDEGFKSSFTTAKHPRSIFGITENNKWAF